MEKKRPQLKLEELHQLRWLLGSVLVLLSVATVFYLDMDAWVMMGLAAAGAIAVVARPRWPALVPAPVHRFAFPAIVLFFVGDLVLTREVLPAIVRLDLLLLGYRGVTYRKKRDDLQVVILGLFLIVVAGVLTVSLVFAAQLLVFTACALIFLLVVTLVESAESAETATVTEAPGPPAWTDVKWRHLFARVRAVTDWRVVVMSGALFAGVVGVSAVLFLAIPRFQLENSLFLEKLMSKKARSGFNETIKFGDVTEIQTDTSVAVSVDVTDRTQIPATPYWRMLVLDQYLNGSFRLSPELRRAAFTPEATNGGTLGGVKGRRDEAVYWTFYLESGISRYLPLLGPFVEVRFREIQNYRGAPRLGLIALRDEPVTMMAYRVEGMSTADRLPDPDFAERLRNSTSPLTDRVMMLRLGVDAADQERLRQKVAEITGGAHLSVADFVRRTETWLGRHHGYSLNPKIPTGSGDTLVRWLESDESGHCELFAGSFVLLARAAGYPTRIVTGFRGGSWNGYSNNFSLRNSDAHAWCEIFDRASGAWVRADPTLGAAAAAQTEEAPGEASLVKRMDRSWSARLESLRVFWYRRIVNFDQRSQVETLQAVKSATENTGRRLRELLLSISAQVTEWFHGPWDVQRWVTLFGVIAAATGLGWGWRRLGRVWWRGWRRSRPGLQIDPIRVEAGLWLRRLEDFPGTGESEPEVKAELRRLRFGAPATWPEPAAVFRRAGQARRRLRAGRREKV